VFITNNDESRDRRGQTDQREENRRLVKQNPKEEEVQQMLKTAEQELSKLLENSSREREVHFNIGEGILRLNLKTEDIILWGETLKNISEPGNVLLACENSQVALSSTKLTWIVGAAIRSTMIEKKSDIVKVLKSLDIPKDIAEGVSKHCPGLGTEITWAFYLERHGWLTASPIIDTTKQINGKDQ
jgi:CRISPR/Cas system CMR subunit Cmr6 (Cas7 group RAMP superfamily)